MTPKKANSPENIYIFVPNLIGYSRIALTLTAIYSAFDSWKIFILAYSLGAILDLFDGMAARHFNQSTKFGAVLDMVTDRVSTNLLYIVLAVLFPKFYFVFALLAAGDYSSHWAQMYSAALLGSHHKVLAADRNWLLRFYYSNKPFMFLNCLGQEAFLIALYGWKQSAESHPFMLDIAFWVMVICFPFCALKQLINVIQLLDSLAQIAKLDVAERNKI